MFDLESAISHKASPTGTSAVSCAKNLRSVPAAGDSSSKLTFSVSSSTNGSPTFTLSPSRLSQRTTITLVLVTPPLFGTITVVKGTPLPRRSLVLRKQLVVDSHQWTCRSACSQYGARIFFRSILPAAVFGISSQNSTNFGAFTPPSFCLQCEISVALLKVEPGRSTTNAFTASPQLS